MTHLRPGRPRLRLPRPPRLPGAALAASVVTVAAAAVLVGCGSGADDSRTGAGDQPEHGAQHSSGHGSEGGSQQVELGHVHGIGVDPADGRVYVASHLGVFVVGDDGSAERIADRWQDTMAFTVIGPGHFLASGHPDLREDLPSSLGLIESVDAGRTWRPLSLEGEADFHALEVAGDVIWGYDSMSGRLLVTADRESWREVDDVPLLDIAAPDHPTGAGSGGRLLATTTQGQVVAYDEPIGTAEVTPEPLHGPPLVLLDYVDARTVVGLAPDSTVHVSGDHGASWAPVGSVPGQVQALEATGAAWYVATDEGVYRSTDDGRRWRLLVAVP